MAFVNFSLYDKVVIGDDGKMQQILLKLGTYKRLYHYIGVDGVVSLNNGG